MSERMGQLTYEHTPNSAFLPTTASLDEQLYSDNTAEMIDEEVRTYQRPRLPSSRIDPEEQARGPASRSRSHGSERNADSCRDRRFNQ